MFSAIKIMENQVGQEEYNGQISLVIFHWLYLTLREKYPNIEFFLVCIFLYSYQKKLRIWTLF